MLYIRKLGIDKLQPYQAQPFLLQTFQGWTTQIHLIGPKINQYVTSSSTSNMQFPPGSSNTHNQNSYYNGSHIPSLVPMDHNLLSYHILWFYNTSTLARAMPSACWFTITFPQNSHSPPHIRTITKRKHSQS